MPRGCLRAAVMEADRLVEDGHHPLDVGAGDLRVGGVRIGHALSMLCVGGGFKVWWRFSLKLFLPPVLAAM